MTSAAAAITYNPEPLIGRNDRYNYASTKAQGGFDRSGFSPSQDPAKSFHERKQEWLAQIAIYEKQRRQKYILQFLFTIICVALVSAFLYMFSSLLSDLRQRNGDSGESGTTPSWTDDVSSAPSTLPTTPS